MDDKDPTQHRRSVSEIRLEALEARKRSMAARKEIERRRRQERIVQALVFLIIVAVAAGLFIAFPR